MAKFFNSGIEKIVYEPPVRNRIGVGRSGTVYTSPAWSMNVVYARLRPREILSHVVSWVISWRFPGQRVGFLSALQTVDASRRNAGLIRLG
jgi:hypothetical protein